MGINIAVTVPKEDRDTLAALVGDLDTFASEHWGLRPLHRQAGAAPVLRVEDVESLMLTGARPPTFRLVNNGERFGPERSTRPTRLAGQRIADVADLERIAMEVGNGATLVVQALEKTFLPVAELCQALTRATSHTVQANAYLTPPGAVGLAPHRDEHDVIVVQQSGRKAWTVEGLGEVTLEPGDVLYMPAGTTHSAQAQTTASLHLTIGLLTRSWAALIRNAIEADEYLRAPLPLGFAYDPGFTEAVAERIRCAAAQLAGADVGAVAAKEQERAGAPRPLLRGYLSDVLDLGDIDLSTTVVRRMDQPARLEAVADGVAVVMRDRTITFPSIGRAALERLLAGEPTTVGELRGIDDGSKVVVVRRLVRAALLRISGDLA